VKTIKLKNFYVQSGLFTLLSLVGALFSYALYPILVRILSPEEFGDFATIVAISNQLLGVLLAFNIISIYLVKSQTEEKAREHSQIIQKSLIWFFLVLVLLFALVSPYLHSLLKIQNFGSFVILGAILIIAVPGIIWTGYLLGNKEMARIGIYNASSSLVKLISASFLAVALGAAGGVLGILVGSIVGLAIMRAIPGVKLPSLSSLFKKGNSEEKKFLISLRKYILQCVIVVGTLSLLQNYDITLAKALFDPTAAGIYSGISIISNALYYLSFLLIWIILPEISLHDSAINKRVLSTAYKLLGLLTVVSVSAAYILRDYIAKILLGPSFTSQGDVLIFATMYQLTLVGITLYAFYLLVMRQRRSILLAGLVLAGCAVVSTLSPEGPLEMIRMLWLALVISFALYWTILKIYLQRSARSRIT